MGIIKDWIKRLRKGHMLSIICTFLVIIIALIVVIWNKQREAKQTAENSYNMAFYELVNYVQDIETYLAKALISNTPEHGAETLTNVWREANLAQTYLSRLPIESQELESTAKFLNQVSDYSFSLSRKNIYNEELTEEDLSNLKQLHSYSLELENTLNQLSDDINSGRIKWDELTKKGTVAFAQQVSTDTIGGFSNIEEELHEYSGLIYDGAFSEHITGVKKKGLTGDDIEENQAKDIVQNFIGNNYVEKIESLGYAENATIPSYNFYLKTKNDVNMNMSISKKGGHVISLNSDREVNTEIISQEDANEIGKQFLNDKGFKDMRETYFLKENGIVTINYAYVKDDVVVYSDLIKVKVALDNGEVLGIETTGYLNNHTEDRDVTNVKISKEEAKNTINKDLEIKSEGLAIIPTEYKTEILCYEFKGNVEGRDFLVYINAENGREEDILVIENTPNGTLTM